MSQSPPPSTAAERLRRVAPVAAAACAALLAAAYAGLRRGRLPAGDPPDREYAPERMEDNATGEGMPERD